MGDKGLRHKWGYLRQCQSSGDVKVASPEDIVIRVQAVIPQGRMWPRLRLCQGDKF